MADDIGNDDGTKQGMADDIVTRLRTVVAVPNGVDIWTMTALDAVDEIERLREIAEAAAQYHDVACNPDWCRLCRAISAWKEARRG